MAKIIIFVNYINDNVAAVTLFIAMIGGVFGWVKFREYVKDRRFETYHKLIDELVDKDSHLSGKLMLDRQIAIIYELRNFPKYSGVTRRILKGLVSEEPWKSGNPRLLTEINLTLDYLKSNKLIKLFKKHN